MIEISTIRKSKKIIGIALVIVGLILFFISYNNGLIWQKVYSNQGCAVDSRPNSCTSSNDQIIFGFGMIFSFFIALFGASLVVPSALMGLIKRKRRLFLLSLTLLLLLGASLAYGSNESSYKFGYKIANDNLTGMITVPPYWNKSTDIVQICDTGDGCPSVYDAENNYCLTGQGTSVTNSTACIDGYVQAWKDWCIGDDYKNAKTLVPF